MTGASPPPTIEQRLAALESENIEIRRRLGAIEGQFEFISRQLRESHAYMHAKFGEIDGRLDRIEDRLDRVDGRLDRVEGRLDRVEGRLGRVEAEVRGLREDLPGIVGTVMREVLAEQRRG
jgi:tetrahydromethanopterin S-methyltransferase subunit G